jgi:thiol-disulfide isomerase/thioredoxin
MTFRTPLLTFLLLSFCTSLIAQQQPAIIFKVIGGENKKIRYTPPVNGEYFPDFPVEDTLDANGELVVPNTKSEAGAYLFFYKKTYRLYVVPGQQYKVTINPENKEHPIAVDAPESEGQLALLKLSWDFSQTIGLRLYRADSVFANNKQKVMQLMDSCLQPFEQLYKQHKLSRPFYAYAKSCIKNYYGSVLATTLTMPVMNAAYYKDSGYDYPKLKQIDKHWRAILRLADVKDPVARTTDTYQEYFYFYNTFYLSYFLYRLKGGKLAKGADNDDLKFYNIEFNITKEPLREYLLAANLRTLILEARFQVFIPDLYAEFINQYPRSRYIPYLAEGVEKVKQFYTVGKTEFTAGQLFVPNYDSIGSVEELLSGLKGKTMYIDLWATWCGPCKAQFAFKKELDLFLKSKGVDVLYISLDRAGAEQKWKSMIKYYNLEGYHIMASEKLIRDIYKVFSNGKGISIPHYAICKDGKIVLADAKQPSDKAVLYKQIESVL